jgi:hypothetical protein
MEQIVESLQTQEMYAVQGTILAISVAMMQEYRLLYYF